MEAGIVYQMVFNVTNSEINESCLCKVSRVKRRIGRNIVPTSHQRNQLGEHGWRLPMHRVAHGVLFKSQMAG